MFPTSINGQIELKALKPEHVETVTRGIKRQLETEKAFDISQRGNIISFRGGFFSSRLANRFNLFSPTNKGEIEVMPGVPAAIKYRLSAIGMAAEASLIALAVAIFIGITRNPATACLVFLLMFSLLFGINYLVAMLRLTSFINHGLIISSEGPLACPNCGALYDPADYLDDAPEKRCTACQKPI